jgi:pimeloyl-ACP methyl ester carboxylesterase
MDQSPEAVFKKLSSGPFRECVYRDTGNGFPVMLVHGFPIDGSLWRYQAEKLASYFRLLIPDLPGSGQSPLTGSLRIEDMAEFLQAILEQEDIEQCILIGHSMGGYAALAYAEKYPEKLKGLGLIHSTAFADTEEKKQGRLRSVDLMQHYGAGVFLRQMMPGLFAEKFRKNNREELLELIKSKENASVEALTIYYRAMMERPDRTEVLKQTRAPVLFVIGKEDTAASAKDVLQQVSLPAVSEVHLFENVAHMGMLEIPDMTTHVIKQFVSFSVDFPFS